jgi:REP element-mobilizing transposase RayT
LRGALGMGRPIRRQAPGQYYLVTTRCHQARFFLRPDAAVNAVVLEWLARSQRRFPSVIIHAVCVMSNHLHLLVCDESAELSDWAGFFLGNLARAVNRIRGRRGSFFERRYSAEPVLDVEALHDRLLYVVTNPVKADLCRRAKDWPGVVLFAASQKRTVVPVSWVDRSGMQKGNADDTGASLAAAAVRVDGVLVVDPIPALDSEGSASVAQAVREREQTLAKGRPKQRRRMITRARILAQSWRSAPRNPKRSRRPLCHAADRGVREAFVRGFRAFVSLFQEASAMLRDGVQGARFPEWSFPPGGPLVLPAGSPMAT